jgi:hypothetical protein
MNVLKESARNDRSGSSSRELSKFGLFNSDHDRNESLSSPVRTVISSDSITQKVIKFGSFSNPISLQSDSPKS